jgi:hypothetical protein
MGRESFATRVAQARHLTAAQGERRIALGHTKGVGHGQGERVVAATLRVLSLGVASPAASAASCSPRQHGNPHPGFNPGNC